MGRIDKARVCRYTGVAWLAWFVWFERADDKSNDNNIMVGLGDLELAPQPISHFREFTKHIPALPPPSHTIS